MSEFVDYLSEVFEEFGRIHARRMFGGYGIYHEGTMFALVVDDTLYLKADDQSVAHFKARHLGPFEYHKRAQTVALSYYLAPEEVLDDRVDALLWARRAFDAALRAQARRRPRKK